VRSCSRHSNPAREARASTGKPWNPTAEASCRKAEAYTATAASTAEVAPASASSTTTTESSSTAAVASRPRGRTQCKQSESNYANYSFCFHTRTLARAARRCYCASAGFCDVTCGMMRAPSFEIGYVRRVARLLKVARFTDCPRFEEESITQELRRCTITNMLAAGLSRQVVNAFKSAAWPNRCVPNDVAVIGIASQNVSRTIVQSLWTCLCRNLP
jgi:hypothetical protein